MVEKPPRMRSKYAFCLKENLNLRFWQSFTRVWAVLMLWKEAPGLSVAVPWYESNGTYICEKEVRDQVYERVW